MLLNGTNWISNGWVEHIFETDWTHWTGTVHYNGTLLDGTDPGFVNIGAVSGSLAADNYTLTDTASVLNRAEVLASQVINAGYDVTEMYLRHQSSEPRSVVDSAMDLGAFEFGSGSGGSDNDDGSDTSDDDNGSGDSGGSSGCFISTIN